MGKTFEISALLASLTAKPLPLPEIGDLSEVIIFPLPRYPKFSIANFEHNLQAAASTLRFEVCDLSYDSHNEPTDGYEVQKLCITFNPAADSAIAMPLIHNALQREYDREGMQLEKNDLSFECR